MFEPTCPQGRLVSRSRSLSDCGFGHTHGVSTDVSLSLEAIAMLWTILVILFVLWLLGFTLHIGGGLIHILLVIALIVLVIQLFQMFSGRRSG